VMSCAVLPTANRAKCYHFHDCMCYADMIKTGDGARLVLCAATYHCRLLSTESNFRKVRASRRREAGIVIVHSHALSVECAAARISSNRC
jgi:hypothetical protein